MPKDKKKIQDILNRFSRATIKAAMADRPEIMQAAGRFIVDFTKDAFHDGGGPLLLNPYAGGGGLSRSKDYKSSKKPYPSVKSGDFAGGGRSYPIPTKADAVDALRLAGLHHRPDVKAKVYAKYPSLKHADGGPLDNGIDYSGIETTNNRKYNPDYISYIDSALANAQLSDAKRASILANIIEESGGDPFAKDSTGNYYGLMQWADNRYKAGTEKDPYKEIDNQVAYILDTIGNSTDRVSWTHGGSGSGYNSYKDAMADFDAEDLATAMKGFTLGYVRPTGKMDSYNNRLKVAEQLLDRYTSIPKAKAKNLFERLMNAYGGDIDRVSRVFNGYAGGGDKKRGEPSPEGGYTSSVESRERVNGLYDPSWGLDLGAVGSKILEGSNNSHGEENEYWRAYLGLENNVPKMNPGAKTEWDDQVEARKIENGELPSDFYGTTPRMDQMIQVVADTLNTGNIMRNYDYYKSLIPDLAPEVVFRHMYNQGKKVMDNPNQWTQVTEGPQMYLYDKIDSDTNEQMPLGMLADFGMMWSPEEGKLKVHDTYDFPWYATALTSIPVRPKEMKIRGVVNYDPSKGSILLRDGIENANMAAPIATKKSH